MLKNHQISYIQLVGEYRTLLASSSGDNKRLFHILTIDEGTSEKFRLEYVLNGEEKTLFFSGLALAIRAYNSF